MRRRWSTSKPTHFLVVAYDKSTTPSTQLGGRVPYSKAHLQLNNNLLFR